LKTGPTTHEPKDDAPGVSADDATQREARERSPVDVHVLHQAVVHEGNEEIGRGSGALAWSGLAAGLSMSFSLLGVALLKAHLPDQPWADAIARLGYSLGFLVVILGRQQLFTENTITVILPLMSKPTVGTFGNVLRVWGIVLVTNLIGGIAVATVLAKTHVAEVEVRDAMAEISAAAVNPSFWTIFLRGIFAGWILALLVWISPATTGGGRVLVIIILTWTIGLAHFSHSIAGTIEAAYGAFAGEFSWLDAFGKYLPASLLGNIVGGVSLTAAINHAQVTASDN